MWRFRCCRCSDRTFYCWTRCAGVPPPPSPLSRVQVYTSDSDSDSGQPTNHLDLEGLDALMLALNIWNGGVIVISHDERFITSVAKEVRSSVAIFLLRAQSDNAQKSSGCVEMAQSQSSGAMSKPTRSVVGLHKTTKYANCYIIYRT